MKKMTAVFCNNLKKILSIIFSQITHKNLGQESLKTFW